MAVGLIRHHEPVEAAPLVVLLLAAALIGRWLLRDLRAHPANFPAPSTAHGLGIAVADASGPGLLVARMMTKDGRYPPGFAAATSVVSATLGPLGSSGPPLPLALDGPGTARVEVSPGSGQRLLAQHASGLRLLP